MKRYQILDKIRGITLVSMILYHAVWDLVYMFGFDWNWYRSDLAYLWQQSICWCFILLSGFCFSMGKRKWRRGLVVFGSGTLITIITHLVMPAQKVRFGVLTMLGVSMLLMALLEKIMALIFTDKKWSLSEKCVGLGISAVLFLITRDINFHHLGFEGIRLCRLSDVLYRGNDFMTFLGFTGSGFYSTDYFSLMPWFFLFASGYYFYHVAKERNWLYKLSEEKKNTGIEWKVSTNKNDRIFTRFLSWMGRHSLVIYMLHQPVIYSVLCFINVFGNAR